MAEKYEDLHEPMVNDETFYLTPAERVGALVALQWLDQHPDQVPGRTITESEFKHAARRNQMGDSFGCYEGFLDDLGITVVPDPEPTNAEKLELIWADWDPTREGVWEFFDRRGVKAPGADDD